MTAARDTRLDHALARRAGKSPPAATERPAKASHEPSALAIRRAAATGTAKSAIVEMAPARGDVCARACAALPATRRIVEAAAITTARIRAAAMRPHAVRYLPPEEAQPRARLRGLRGSRAQSCCFEPWRPAEAPLTAAHPTQKRRTLSPPFLQLRSGPFSPGLCFSECLRRRGPSRILSECRLHARHFKSGLPAMTRVTSSSVLADSPWMRTRSCFEGASSQVGRAVRGVPWVSAA